MPIKICTKCKRGLFLRDFSKDQSRDDGLNPYCRECTSRRGKKHYEKNRNKLIQKSIKYRKEHPEKNRQASHKYNVSEHGRGARRSYELKRKYSITLKQHEQMYIDQNGQCKICGKPVAHDKIHTDHNHETGKVRGLLCMECNMRLGILEDIKFCSKAIRYLEVGGS